MGKYYLTTNNCQLVSIRFAGILSGVSDFKTAQLKMEEDYKYF